MLDLAIYAVVAMAAIFAAIALFAATESYRGAKLGFLFNPGALWIGAHWSAYHKRLCINAVPFFTVWVTMRGGFPPR